MTTIVFLGAGSVVFTRELLVDILGFPELADARIVLHDIDPERLATAEALAGRVADAYGVRPSIVATLDRRAALDGADFVINSIQVGMYAATRVDFDVPARFGLRQTIGDTIGIGGIFRGLRTFPVLAGIAADMAALCPDAWLLNYTNPMAMNITYLARIAPQLKVLGLCHSVYWTVQGLCSLVDVPFEEVRFESAGVNHQAWILRWERDGVDLYPLLDAAIARDPQLRRRVRVDLYRRLGYYPTETSEHSAEYVPWYLRHDTEISRLRIPVGEYLAVSEANLASYAATRDGVAEVDLSRDTTEYAPQVIHSMVTGTPRRIVANVANRGLIDNLPSGFAVEVPTTVDGTGARPSPVGSLPVQLAAVNRPYVSVGELTVEAAVTGDPRFVRQAAMVDPNTAASLTVDAIWDLCDALTSAHGDLLPEGLRA
ncbi:alpha-glucosidase/alpha-galactosidase [Asanoa ishikariensis]|uniref:Alpha-galactosidase n=1 Tax=Asanoa ishikariensis TaxID=137265 RepID=A0A1H3UY14_9ACTN|nr:alpha-glucosidase/alpha-galactosidase [Asanoa ishikariensis]GIF69992.1 alpha-glucosidase/alpha-galactosidase [Asanoa ishikariensis]SDZ67176.1 alpha-galactosidase [Asanoa ishikariensis]